MFLLPAYDSAVKSPNKTVPTNTYVSIRLPRLLATTPEQVG